MAPWLGAPYLVHLFLLFCSSRQHIFELHVELPGVDVLATVAACADAARELDADGEMPHLSTFTTARATSAANAGE